MGREQMIGALEAILFVAGDPLSLSEIARIFERLWAGEPTETHPQLKAELKEAIAELRGRWSDDSNQRGFALVEVADGLVFRTNARYGDALKAMREQRPVRLSRAALETLAIVAYRQPVTKPEVDHIRGVDCSATIRLLLDRRLIRIMGKKEEPGLPLLYGTTREFLSFFNLPNLAQLPSLREFHELTADSRDELETFDAQSLEEMSQTAKSVPDGDEPAAQELEAAMDRLRSTERATHESLSGQGIQLEPAGPAEASSRSAEPSGSGATEPAAATEPENVVPTPTTPSSSP